MNDKIKQLMANRIGGRGTIRRKTPNRKRMLKHKPKRISVLEKQYNLIINRINKFIIIKQINKLKIKQYLIDRFMDFFKNTIKRKDYQKKKVIQNINTFMLQKFKTKFTRNLEITILGFLIFLTIISTSYYNYDKKKSYQIIRIQ